ncbi:HTH-type transcriptional activator RhaR [Pseudoalteromonas holothuriae]|uniref:HTH-type transcriptional activator RhaR n=1 Tax=Pseudoalteromonas holothuriae TaxID=2963714 RepID=A0A9W4QTM6_9GAMM|nr:MULTISPECIES: AraC family transcriptional regulator [unclassified Pseudoalteromonas]CAH9050446.1 HTH-type transcriptional activator RhaR [Pseudoalteromonas sp. CIP111951]CAH9052236.1 HTH-type transcriptional activator RhaR [Pseudoalteromonas sp. CIP111854]
MTLKNTTKHSYRQRLLTVIDYLYGHLDMDLDVNTLAERANMSAYHFHRIYREFTNETVNTTVRRMRLFKAATLLLHSNLSQIDIAKQVKYASVEAFNRAFTKHYGETPNQYRKHRSATKLESSVFYPTDPKEYNKMYDVEHINNEGLTLIALSHQGDYMQIGQTFDKLAMLTGSAGLINDNARSFGIYYDDPKTVNKDLLRSMACISIENPNSELPNKQLQIIQLPAGKAISVIFKGDYTELDKPYDWLFGQWIPNNQVELEDFPPFEEYLNDVKSTPPSQLLTRISCLIK